MNVLREYLVGVYVNIEKDEVSIVKIYKSEDPVALWNIEKALIEKAQALGAKLDVSVVVDRSGFFDG